MDALSIEQLPTTRREILLVIKTRGPQTIAELSQRLGISGEGVRRQLQQMVNEGWLEQHLDRDSARGRGGRPATQYAISNAGDHLFPKRYAPLAVALIDAASELGEDILRKVLDSIVETNVAAWLPALNGLPVEQKVDALKGLYLEDDPFMRVEREDSRYRLIEHNCAYLNTALERPSLCSVTINTMRRLLGVHVEREQRFQDGDRRCVFGIDASRPVEKRPFVFEKELSGDSG